MKAPERRAGQPRIVYVYLAIIVVTWAGNWPLMKLALGDAPPLVFVLLRLIGTVVLMAPLLAAMRVPLLPIPGERLGLFWVGQFQVAGFLLFAIVGLAIVAYNWIVTTALGYFLWALVLTAMPATIAGQVLALTPVGGFLLSIVIFGGAVTPDVIASIALIVAGIILTLRA